MGRKVKTNASSSIAIVAPSNVIIQARCAQTRCLKPCGPCRGKKIILLDWALDAVDAAAGVEKSCVVPGNRNVDDHPEYVDVDIEKDRSDGRYDKRPHLCSNEDPEKKLGRQSSIGVKKGPIRGKPHEHDSRSLFLARREV